LWRCTWGLDIWLFNINGGPSDRQFREQHRAEDSVDGSVGADEEPLDRAGESSWRTVTGITPREIVRIWTITRPTITNPK